VVLRGLRPADPRGHDQSLSGARAAAELLSRNRRRRGAVFRRRAAGRNEATARPRRARCHAAPSLRRCRCRAGGDFHLATLRRPARRALSESRLVTAAPLDHATSRGRRVFLSMATGLPAYGVQVACGLLLVTLAWRALGADGFGLWAAITASAPLIALADLG